MRERCSEPGCDRPVYWRDSHGRPFCKEHAQQGLNMPGGASQPELLGNGDTPRMDTPKQTIDLIAKNGEQAEREAVEALRQMAARKDVRLRNRSEFSQAIAISWLLDNGFATPLPRVSRQPKEELVMRATPRGLSYLEALTA